MIYDDDSYAEETDWPLWFIPIFIVVIIATYVTLFSLDLWDNIKRLSQKSKK